MSVAYSQLIPSGMVLGETIKLYAETFQEGAIVTVLAQERDKLLSSCLKRRQRCSQLSWRPSEGRR